MKGVILCGGSGSRLKPLTNIQNKHLLPIYDRPMVYYPIQTLVSSGINEIMIVVSGEHAGSFIKLLKNGEDFKLKSLVYAYQSGGDKGIADALKLAKTFANGDNLAVILGDNTSNANISKEINNFKSGAHLFIKKVPNPEAFGVPEFDGKKIINIVEKPKFPASNYAITGFYLYDNKVFDYLDQLVISDRGEYEISDLNMLYLKAGTLKYSKLKVFWRDCGTVENLFIANKYWHDKAKRKQ